MANLNKVFLIGRLTQDPELRYTPGGAAVTDLRMAVNRIFAGREGETKEETLFIDVTVWNRQAENCCQFLKKGRQVHVEGYLRTDSWDDRATGEKRSKIKVVADNVQFLDSQRGGDDAGADEAAPPRESQSRRPSAGPDARSGPSNGASRSYPPPGGNRPTPPPPASAPEEADDD